jgi:hypothetical protein
MLVGYNVLRRSLQTIHPAYAAIFALLWLGLVLWVWLAPGIGNFLILLDRSARLALKRGEWHQGLAVGGGLLLGILAGVTGLFVGSLPVLLGAAGLVASTVPAALAFDNDSRVGRVVFGSITGFIYLATVIVVGVEAFRAPTTGLSPLTPLLGGLALLGAIACTWLGNVRSLRRGSEG